MNEQRYFSRPAHQQGAALVTALVLLTILMLLALTSMTTNTLEEKMAANAQEVNRAFQAAESGLSLALRNVGAFNYNNTVDDQGTFDKGDDVYDFESPEIDLGTYGAKTQYRAWFREKKTGGIRAAKAWDVGNAFYFFDLSSTGSTGGPANAVSTRVRAGAYQVGPE